MLNKYAPSSSVSYVLPAPPPQPALLPYLGLGVEKGLREELDGEVGTHEAGAGLV